MTLILALLSFAQPRRNATGIAGARRLLCVGNGLAIDQYFGRAVGCGRVSIRLSAGRFLGALLLLLACFFIVTLFILAPVVISILVADEAVRDPANEEPPEQIDSLKGGEQSERDDLRDPAFVLLCFPVEFIGTNGLELGKNGVKHAEVDPVTEVAPGAHENEEVGTCDGRIKVVEDLRCLF